MGSTTAPMDLSSPVSSNEYDINDMEPIAQRAGKGKADFIDVSDDPIIGNHQTSKVFWERIAEKFNAGRPRRTYERSYMKLQKHWGRVQREFWKWLSGHSEMDLMAKNNEEFYNDAKKHFTYYDVWKLMKKSPKYTGGAQPARSGAPKRTKVSTSINYSTSNGGPIIDLNVTDDDVLPSSPNTQSRPMGNKTTKRKAKGNATMSYPTMLLPPSPNPSLDKMSDSMSEMNITLQMGHLRALMASAISEFELELQNKMIAFIHAQINKK
ncbi:glutathione S-transferase T3-like [Salvia hispanica]|uniref:glutathione S-transferase T3-like n=1 Tax=Salvia hispanica TaxID=49212 RepID=UPI002008F2C6|nr:glutathione S-transferase T3-like [Salvia hispanica]